MSAPAPAPAYGSCVVLADVPFEEAVDAVRTALAAVSRSEPR